MADLNQSLGDMIQKDRDVNMKGDKQNKGGKGGKTFKNKQGGRPRYNDSKNNTRSALFKPQKSGNQISKNNDRGGDRRRGGGNDRVGNKVRANILC